MILSGFQFLQLLLAGAVILAALLSNNYRGVLWIVAIVADMLLSSAYWRAGLPWADFVTAFCDFSVCVLIFLIGARRWELWLFLLYMFSMLVSIVDMGNWIDPRWVDHDIYSSVLEAINLLSLVFIGGVSGFVFRRDFDLALFDRWRWLRPAGLPLLGEAPRDGS